MVIGRSGESTLRLSHPTISRKHATVSMVAGGLGVVDHDSRFGTFVNGARVRVATLRPGDRVQFGSAVAYRVGPGGLQPEALAGGMTLAATGLSITAPGEAGLGRLAGESSHAVAAGGGLDRRRPGPKPLIEGVGLHARPDTFTGILGPSGAGKSTLMNCLAGCSAPARGRLAFDGRRDAYGEVDAYRAMLGHVRRTTSSSGR